MFRYILHISVALVLLTAMGCRKDAFDADFTRIAFPTDADARCLFLKGDSLYVGGGNFDQEGYVAAGALNTLDFDLLRSDFKREIYSLNFHKERWYIGGDSLLMYRGRQLRNMPQYYWKREDWVSDLSNHPIRDMAQDSTGILMVAGRKLAFGVVYQSYDGGEGWDPIEPENEMRCAHVRDGFAWVGGNGILMRSEWGSSVWERLPLEDRFITDLHFTTAISGWALTEKGAVLATTDGGSSWDAVRSDKLPFMSRMAVAGDFMVCVGESGTVAYSTNTGADWKVQSIEGSSDLNDVLIWNGRCYIAADGGQLITFLLDDLK
ncbi:MAG: hypothetical protein HQ500_00915 [Flavobacteriales bacterium]|nr:hypothetical protein [Flavobacteriales bacterium]